MKEYQQALRAELHHGFTHTRHARRIASYRNPTSNRFAPQQQLACGRDDCLGMAATSKGPHEHHVLALGERDNPMIAAHRLSSTRTNPFARQRLQGRDDLVVPVAFSSQAEKGTQVVEIVNRVRGLPLESGVTCRNNNLRRHPDAPRPGNHTSLHFKPSKKSFEPNRRWFNNSQVEFAWRVKRKGCEQIASMLAFFMRRKAMPCDISHKLFARCVTSIVDAPLV